MPVSDSYERYVTPTTTVCLAASRPPPVTHFRIKTEMAGCLCNRAAIFDFEKALWRVMRSGDAILDGFLSAGLRACDQVVCAQRARGNTRRPPYSWLHLCEKAKENEESKCSVRFLRSSSERHFLSPQNALKPIDPDWPKTSRRQCHP